MGTSDLIPGKLYATYNTSRFNTKWLYQFKDEVEACRFKSITSRLIEEISNPSDVTSPVPEDDLLWYDAVVDASDYLIVIEFVLIKEHEIFLEILIGDKIYFTNKGGLINEIERVS